MNQTKYKWMLFLVLILLISNMVLAFFLFFGNNKKQWKRDSPDEWAMKIYNEIGLDANQIKVFKEEKDSFFSTMRPVWNENKQAKERLYNNLAINPTDSSVILLLEQIKSTNHYSDSFTFIHFQKLRALCTDEQKIRFDTIMPKLITRPRNRR